MGKASAPRQNEALGVVLALPELLFTARPGSEAPQQLHTFSCRGSSGAAVQRGKGLKGSEPRVHKPHQHSDTATAAQGGGRFCRKCYPGKARRAECVFPTRRMCQVQQLRL